MPKIYRALINQPGDASAPTAIELENTLGGTPVFSRIGAGLYEMTLAGAFPFHKTLPVLSFTSLDSANLVGVGIGWNNADSLLIQVTTVTGSPNDFGLNNNVLTIRVYP